MAAVPPLSGSTPMAAPRPVSDARAAAQRAFFQAALGKVEVPRAAEPAARVARPTVQAAPAARASFEPVTIPARPERLMRPGSLVDIKV